MKSYLLGALLAGAGLGLPGLAGAQDFPTRPINMIVGFAAGSSTDNIARYYAQAMGDNLEQPIVVQNRPGASQAAAVNELLGSDPDGHTVMMITGSASSQGPGVRDDLPYKTMEDFVPVAMVATASGVFVANPALPFDDMAGMIAYAKEHPGELNYGSSGLGSASNLQFELLKSITGIDMAHIPYEGSAQIMTAILKGEADIGLGPIQGALPLIQSGQIRALGLTGSQRDENIPDVPALSEGGMEELSVLDPYTYYLIVVPQGTPQPVIEKLHAAFNDVSELDQSKTVLRGLGFEPVTRTVDEAREHVLNDVRIWRDFREATGFQWGQ